MIAFLNSSLNILFLLIPLSFILGNGVINGLTALIIVIGLIKFNKTIFHFKQNILLYLLTIFFLLIIFSSFLNYSENSSEFLRSLVFCKYLFLVLILKKIIDEDILNLKFFLYSAALTTLIVSFSVIGEWIYDFQIDDFLLYGDAYQKCDVKVLQTGIIDLTEPCAQNNWAVYNARSSMRYNSGIFFQEKIAGGFIARFSIFLIFLIFYFKKIENYNYKNFLIFFFILFVCQLSALVTGNRMSFFLLLLMNFLYFFVFEIDKKKIIILFTSLALIFTVVTFNKSLHKQYLSFFQNSTWIVINLNKFIIKDTSKEEKINPKPNYRQSGSSHRYLFKTGIEIWKENKFFGSGYKSFRKKCSDVQKKSVYGACSNHPHNYYIEILSENGLVGFVIIFLIIFTIFIKSIHYLKNKHLIGDNLSIIFYGSFLINFFVEMFPLRSSGSFFTTSNSAYIFILLGVLLSNKLNVKKNNFI